MTNLDNNDCRFLRQMYGTTRKLSNAMPHGQNAKPYTAAVKLMSIQKLIRLGLLSGEIGINPDKSLNYENITVTVEGKEVLTVQLLKIECSD